MQVIVEADGQEDRCITVSRDATVGEVKAAAHAALGLGGAVPMEECAFTGEGWGDDEAPAEPALGDRGRVEVVLSARHISRQRLQRAGVVDAVGAEVGWVDAVGARDEAAMRDLLLCGFIPPGVVRGTLFDAAEADDAALLTTILREPAGAAEAAASGSGKTVLTAAVERGRVAAAAALLEHGVPVEAGGHMWASHVPVASAALIDHLKTPLMYAAEKGRLEVVVLLLRHGADPSAVDDGGLSPLLYALQEGHFDAARALATSGGADLNARDHVWMKTPLMYAVEHEQPTFAAWLLDNGAAVDARDCSGGTALTYAAQLVAAEAVALTDLLLQHGADVHSADHRKRTPLMWAAHAGQLGVVKRLAAAGAHLDVVDIEDSTPLACATARGHLPVVRYLMAVRADARRGRLAAAQAAVEE